MHTVLHCQRADPRFANADADALSLWEHVRPLDGLADLVLSGRDQEQVAAEFGAPRLGDSVDVEYGWVDLPVSRRRTSEGWPSRRGVTNPAGRNSRSTSGRTRITGR
jgi:hypothetical protein